jgi:NMD protein affecting ribosome stability and mRNA decay
MRCSDCGKEITGTPNAHVENERVIHLCNKCNEYYDIYGRWRHGVKRAERGQKGGSLLDSH